jgi:hypothetical protein
MPVRSRLSGDVGRGGPGVWGRARDPVAFADAIQDALEEGLNHGHDPGSGILLLTGRRGQELAAGRGRSREDQEQSGQGAKVFHGAR